MGHVIKYISRRQEYVGFACILTFTVASRHLSAKKPDLETTARGIEADGSDVE